MSDTGVAFGRHGNLIGILSEPEAVVRADRPAVLILDRTGPFRMNVDMARSIAAGGYRVLRFDVSGIGDSRVRIAATEREDVPVADTRDAMDWMASRFGVRRFVLVGFCARSDECHRASVADERVVGVTHLDGYGYPTPKFKALHYARRFTSLKYLHRKLAERLGAGTEGAHGAEVVAINTRRRVFPPAEKIRGDYAALMRRGVRLFFLYTRYGDFYLNYDEQLRDAFPEVDFSNHLTVERYPTLGHTFPVVASRAMVNGRILAWLNRELG